MVLAPLLIPLGEIMGWLVALGVCFMAIYFARAFFGTAKGLVGWIPWAGKVASTGIDRVAQKIDSVLSEAALSVDKKMGAALHQLARLWDWIGKELADTSNLVAALATVLLGPTAVSVGRALWQVLGSRVHALEHRMQELARRIVGIEQRQRVGIGDDVLPRVRAGERAIGRIATRDIPGIVGRVGRIDRDLSRLWRWSHRHAALAGTAAFAGAVAFALSRLGAGWVRCSNWRKAGKRICGADSGLVDALLADTLAIVGTVSIVALARELQEITPPVVSTIRSTIREL